MIWDDLAGFDLVEFEFDLLNGSPFTIGPEIFRLEVRIVPEIFFNDNFNVV